MSMSPRSFTSSLWFVVVLLVGPLAAWAEAPALAESGRADSDGTPFAVAVSGGRVYVADFNHDRIRVLARTGEEVRSWGVTGEGPGEFRGPAGVAVGPDGSVFVTDHHNARVQRFTALGEFLAEWRIGTGSGTPTGVAVDLRGRVYVTDLAGGQVSVWTADGTPLAAWGAKGRSSGEMDQPWGIAVDAAGDVFVADHGNHRIDRFSSDGAWLGAWGGPSPAEGGLIGPMGLAVGSDGSVYVTDLSRTGARRFTRGGAALEQWDVRNASPGSRTTGIAVDANGSVVLAEPDGHRITWMDGGGSTAPAPAPSAFALLPVVQPLGRGPVVLDVAVPGPGTVGAEFFSLEGRRVHTVPETAPGAGLYRIAWDGVTEGGRRAPVGVYFARVHYQDGGNHITRSARVVVLR